MKRRLARWTRLILLVAIMLSALGVPAPAAGRQVAAALTHIYAAQSLPQHPARAAALPAGLRAAMQRTGCSRLLAVGASGLS